MVYQERASQIIFMANLVEDTVRKSSEYWQENCTLKFGDMIVEHIETGHYASFIVRRFQIHNVSAPNNARIVTQYQFTDWPNHGIPDDPIPLLEFHRLVKSDSLEDDTNDRHSANGPVVIHCGTGVSRTAVYIAIDALLDQARAENCVNVFNFVNAMRKERVLMVRTLKQYQFIYDALFEALITNHNTIDIDLKANYRLLSNINPVTNKSYFREQFEILEAYVSALDPARCKDGRLEANTSKNRYPSIIPPDVYRPKLKNGLGSIVSHQAGITDYINAVYIDSFLMKDAFILTQTPLVNTIADFWQLIYEQNVTTVVMLDSSDLKEETCAQYWPTRMGMEKYGVFYIDMKETIEEKHVTIRIFYLTTDLKPNDPPRVVRQYQFEAWRMYGKVPWSR